MEEQTPIERLIEAASVFPLTGSAVSDITRAAQAALPDLRHLAQVEAENLSLELKAQIATLGAAVQAILVLVPPVEIPGPAYALAHDITQRLRSEAGITQEICAAHDRMRR